MLFYLDNWESVAPGSVPPTALRVRALERMPKGINENYARSCSSSIHSASTAATHSRT